MPTQIEGINFYTIQETATYLGLTAQTIRTYIRKGRLKSYKISGPILITENSLKEFLGVKAEPKSKKGRTRAKTTQLL